MSDKIYLLRKGYDDDTWSEINKEELDEWFRDGSIHEDDLIVYPAKILKAIEHKTLSLEEVED